MPWVSGDAPGALAEARLSLALAPPAEFELAPAKSAEVVRARLLSPTRIAIVDHSGDAGAPPLAPMDEDVGASWLVTATHVADALWAESRAHLLGEVSRVRKLLTIANRPPIDAIIALGVVPSLVSLLALDDSPAVQFEAAWALTNVASGSSEQARAVVGAIPALVRLLRDTPSDDVREQCAWTIGNLAGDGPELRDAALAAGALAPLLALLDDPAQPLTATRTAAWALSNIVRGKPRPRPAFVSAAIPTLERLARHADDKVVTDAAWALSYLTDGSNENIQEVLDAGAAPHLVALLGRTRHRSLGRDAGAMQAPALRAVGNLLTGDDVQTQAVLDCGLLPSLLALLGHAKQSVRKEACWAVSNVTAGTAEQKQAVVDAGFVERLVALLVADEWNVRKEACWAISNLTEGGDPAHVDAVVSAGALAPLAGLLTVGDAKIVNVALKAMENILMAGARRDGERDGEVSRALELRTLGAHECGGECPIAWVPFATGDEVARMPCGHEFRRDALGTWLKNHSTCPVCRHQLKVGSAMAEAIAEAGGLANIEALQQHSDSDIYVKARRLIEAFFST